MELSVLTPFSDGFKRSVQVESWNSLVWTERYGPAGDFQMVSNNISDILTKMPIGGPFDPPCLVAIKDSDVPMVVESHLIEKPKNGPPQVTTTGRSFETVLDRRVTIQAITPGTPRAEWRVTGATNAAAAAYAVVEAIIVTGIASADDIIPEILLLNSVTDSFPAVDYQVDPKELYEWVVETLALGPYGIKSILPIPSDDQIAVEMYEGTDRRTTTVFDVTLDQVEQAAYLLSKVGYKTAMITGTAHGMEESNTGDDPSTSLPPTGLTRRVDFQDLVTEITLGAGTPLTDLTKNKGLIALADRLPTALFSGGIADSVAEGFGNTYFLGDLVKLVGEYGLTQDARVTEFVRTHDTTGIKSYPTFEAVTS